MRREEREEKAAMIGRENLDIWPWTAERTGAMIFFSVIGVLMIIGGAIFPTVRVPLLFFGITIVLATVVGGIGAYLDELADRMIMGTIRLSVIKYIPLFTPSTDLKVKVVGNDGVEYFLSPETVCRSDADAKSSVVIYGRLERPTICLLLGKDYKRIISLSLS